jgi:hypothetical protein
MMNMHMTGTIILSGIRQKSLLSFMREDFLEVVKETPWMHVWEETILPVIAVNPWPMIQSVDKASHQKLFYEGKVGGLQIGHLHVSRHEIYDNPGYIQNWIRFSDYNKYIEKHFPECQDKANEFYMNNHNIIMEKYSDRLMTDADIRRGLKDLFSKFS